MDNHLDIFISFDSKNSSWITWP